MHIHEIQQDALELCTKHAWPDRNPSQRFRFLISEVGELAKELLRLEWEPNEQQVAEIKQKIGHEIYDIVWNLCDLANQLEIDLEAAFEEKRAINDARRWP
ncbi:MAG: MazG nucleotide pyrophosphohydrolase domain-containing protein [Caldilineaceae bacterium]